MMPSISATLKLNPNRRSVHPAMNQEAVRALADSLLEQVSGWAQDELKVRAEKRRQETIAKIKEMAAALGVAVNIQGQ
jgi:hypothetical protein